MQIKRYSAKFFTNKVRDIIILRGEWKIYVGWIFKTIEKGLSAKDSRTFLSYFQGNLVLYNSIHVTFEELKQESYLSKDSNR